MNRNRTTNRVVRGLRRLGDAMLGAAVMAAVLVALLLPPLLHEPYLTGAGLPFLVVIPGALVAGGITGAAACRRIADRWVSTRRYRRAGGPR